MYKFIIRVYDDGKEREDIGYIVGRTYAESVKILFDEAYTEDEVINLKLEAINDETKIIFIPKKCIQAVDEENNY